MKFPWRPIARLAAQIVGTQVPAAQRIEDAVESIVDQRDTKTGAQKADDVMTLALAGLEAEGTIVGKQYATPRVQIAMRRVNDAVVELHNALAEAHAAAPLADPAN